MSVGTKNKYVDFITDEDFLACIERLYNKYEDLKEEYTVKKFMNNQVDPLKLTSDMLINGLSEQEMIEAEINRQMDKSISNYIGHFQEELLGKIPGYEHTALSGYDIRKKDDTLFAEIKNKENTVNSSSKEATYQKLMGFADENPGAKCYWVSLIAKKSYHGQWYLSINKGKRVYDHPNVYAISGDQFYELLTGDPEAFAKVLRAYPIALNDFLNTKKVTVRAKTNKVYKTLKKRADQNGVTLLEELSQENFKNYNGF